MKLLIRRILHFVIIILAAAAFDPLHAVAAQDSPDMVFVPAGDFIMGLDEREPESEGNPLRTIYLRAFYIDTYEVSNAKYKKCVAAGKCTMPSLIIDYPPTFHEEGKDWYKDATKGNYPVVGITWKQAGEYCAWEGKSLPSAAEWEKAARGTDGRLYPWGNVWDGKKANSEERGKIDGFKMIAPIGSFPDGASPYGAMDMAGNVRELVDNMIFKGGSWNDGSVSLRSGDPGHEYQVSRDDDMGFRCKKDLK